jgi:predicted DNA-binding transcriptional regulator AlpA
MRISEEYEQRQIEGMGGALLDLKAVAAHFGISERGVWRGVASGDFPDPVKVGRCCRWLPSDLMTYTESLKKKRENNRLR